MSYVTVPKEAFDLIYMLREKYPHHANALDSMAWRLQELEPALSEPDFVPIANRGVRELGAGASAQPSSKIDTSPRTLGQFVVARDEIGMQVRLDNMFDLPPVASRRFQVNVDVALRIDDRRNALRSNHVRCVGQAAQIELFHFYRVHILPLYTVSGCATIRR